MSNAREFTAVTAKVRKRDGVWGVDMVIPEHGGGFTMCFHNAERLQEWLEDLLDDLARQRLDEVTL